MPEGQQYKESRRHPRVSSRIRVWCEGHNVTLYASVMDISEGGLFLKTHTPFPAGARATVRFQNGKTVEMPATVVWTRDQGNAQPPGMGLRFDAPPESLTYIRELIEGERKTRGPGEG